MVWKIDGYQSRTVNLTLLNGLKDCWLSRLKSKFNKFKWFERPRELHLLTNSTNISHITLFVEPKKKSLITTTTTKNPITFGGGGGGGKGLEQYFWATEWSYYISKYIFIHSLVVCVVVGFVLLLTLYDTLDRTDCLWKWQISWQMTIWWQRTISWQMTISWQDSEADLFVCVLFGCGTES